MNNQQRMARGLYHLLLSLAFLVLPATGNRTTGQQSATLARIVIDEPPRAPLDSVGRRLVSTDRDDEDTRSNTTDSSNFILDNLVDQLVERVEAEVESRAPRRAPQLAADEALEESVGAPEEEQALHQRHPLQAMKLTEADRRDQHIPYDTDQQSQSSLEQLQYQQPGGQPVKYLQELVNSSQVDTQVSANEPPQVAIVVMDLSSNSTDDKQSETNQTANRARSMYQQPAKAPQHTRPPYASHDQFAPTPSSAVTSSGANSSRTTQETSVAATLEQPPSLVGSAATATTTGATLSNEPTASGRANDSSSAFNQLNSRISGQLAGQRNGQLEAPPLVERSGATFDSKLPEGQLQLQKLQPPNQMVELSPMPATTSNQAPQADFYFPKDQQLRQQPSVALRGDRYPSVGLQDEDFMNSMASSAVHRYGGINGMGELVGSSPAQEPLEPELVLGGDSSSRIQASSLHHLNQATTATNPRGFAASLVNVTAPMVPPVSASEAMESALGLNQKVLLNQASGFIRSQGAPEATVVKSGVGVGSQRHQAAANVNLSPYLSASSLVEPTAAYSQPANQFSPKQSHLTNLDQTDSQLATMITATPAPLSQLEKDRMRLEPALGFGANQLLQARRPQGPYAASAGVHNLTHTTHPASGFRSPGHHHLYQHQHQLTGHSQAAAQAWPSSYLSSSGGGPNLASSAPPAAPSSAAAAASSPAATITNQSNQQQQTQPPRVSAGATSGPPTPLATSSTSSPLGLATASATTTNGFITQGSSSSAQQDSSSLLSLNAGPNRRQFNLTRVEHISAECSNDLIRTVIVFNGTFKGIIYSSGYVRDPNCMYINGTGKSRYDFSIRLNQCGTLGHQELRPPSGPNEVSRQDKVMWNTLSIQYNPIIEQEWDEHFRVSCEYGSDFWKTVSFSPFKVETNTGSPVMFTVDPPQCQMEILKGHGMVGPRQEAVSGPVTVGDPLTLLIHMKSEKAGYDILVKNCVAHNGGAQKMQLIDSNGCVVNERFISPFRGTYNDNDLKHVTLYSYLKAFRFTGSPVLYLECEIHMCQSKCPPQMCYWRRLSKRSASANGTSLAEDSPDDYDQEQQSFVGLATSTYGPPASDFAPPARGRTARQLDLDKDGDRDRDRDEERTSTTGRPQAAQMSDKVSLFQALEVRQESAGGRTRLLGEFGHQAAQLAAGDEGPAAAGVSGLVCYRRDRLLAYLLAGGSSLLAALGVALGCCWRVLSQRRHQLGRQRQRQLMIKTMGLGGSPLSSGCDGLLTSGSGGSSSSSSSSISSSSAMPPVVANEQLINYHKALAQHHHHHQQQQQQHHSRGHKEPRLFAY